MNTRTKDVIIHIIMIVSGIALFIIGSYLYIASIPILPPGHRAEEESSLYFILVILLIASSLILTPTGIISLMVEIWKPWKRIRKNNG